MADPPHGDWWKWTAALLAAVLVGLLPYVFASANFVSDDDLDDSQTVIRQELLEQKVAIAKLNAQMTDLIDRIEQLRAEAAR